MRKVTLVAKSVVPVAGSGGCSVEEEARQKYYGLLIQ